MERLEKSAGGRELSRKACRDATSHLWFEQDGTERTDSSESSGPEANALSPGTEEVEEFERARDAAREIVARSLRRPEQAYIIEIEEIEDVEDLEDVDAQGEPAAEGEPGDQMVIYEVLDASVYEAAPVDPAYDADRDDEVQDALSADRSSFNTLAADRASFNTLSELLRRGQGGRPRRNSGAPAPQSAGGWSVEVANEHANGADSMLETEEETEG